MAEVKYFSHDNASVLAEEIKRLFATKQAQESLSQAMLLMTDVHDTILGKIDTLEQEVIDNELVTASALNEHNDRILALEAGGSTVNPGTSDIIFVDTDDTNDYDDLF